MKNLCDSYIEGLGDVCVYIYIFIYTEEKYVVGVIVVTFY